MNDQTKFENRNSKNNFAVIYIILIEKVFQSNELLVSSYISKQIIGSICIWFAAVLVTTVTFVIG